MVENVPRPGPRATAASLATLAAALAAAFVLGRRPASEVADLKPRPDALEYEEAARSLLRGDGYSLRIEGRRFAPRYPPALSWAIAGAMRVTGTAPGSGAVVPLAAAFVSVAATWALAARAAGPAAAAVACLVVALSPLHVRWSRAVMADVPSTAAVAVLALWCLRRTGRGLRSPAGDVAVGVAAGLLSLLRLGNLSVAIPVIGLAASGPAPGGPGQRAARVLRTAAGIAAGLVPIALLQARDLGAPWRTGYDLWHGAEFLPDFASRPGFGASGGLTNPVFYAKLLAGGGDLYPWPIALLAAAGAIAALLEGGAARRLAAFAGLLAAALLALHVPFFWQWDRFLLPTLPLLAALAGCGAVALARRTRPWVPALLLACGLLLLPPPRAWWPIEDTRTESIWLRAIDATVPTDAVVVLRTDPFHFREILRGGRDDRSATNPGRTWVPLGACLHRAAIRLWKIEPLDDGVGIRPGDGSWLRDALPPDLEPAASSAAIAAILDEGRPVFVATSPRDFEVPQAAPLFARLQQDFVLQLEAARGGWELWRVVDRSVPDASPPEESPLRGAGGVEPASARSGGPLLRGAMSPASRIPGARDPLVSS